MYFENLGTNLLGVDSLPFVVGDMEWATMGPCELYLVAGSRVNPRFVPVPYIPS